MPREENSAVPGPQTRVGCTTYSDRIRVQPDNALFSTSKDNIEQLKQHCRSLREDVLQTELRDRGVVEFDQWTAWKSDQMRAPSDYGNTPGSSAAANAGSSRGGTESDFARDDTLQSTVAELHDNFECLRGVDPNGSSATLKHCPYSTHDFSAELPPNLQETGSRRLVNGGSGE